MDTEDFPSTPRRTSSTDASFRSQSQPPLAFPRNQSRRQPPPSPRSSNAQPRTQQNMYRSDHGTRVNFPSNTDGMGFQSSSMFEGRSGHEGTCHVDHGLDSQMH